MIKFIVNPNAGGEKGFSTWKICERRLQKLNIPYKVYITDGPGDATRLAKRATEAGEAVTIVPVGGDGTFNEVLNGINISDNVTVGYIPTGSGNDLARGLGFSGDPEKALDVILERKEIVKLDYGVLTYGQDYKTERRFAVSMGIGYDAATCVAIDGSSMRRKLSKLNMQKAVYLTLGAIQIFKSRPSGGYIIADDGDRADINDVMFISSQIHVTEGGGKPFTPDADPQDGLLSVCVMCGKSKPAFIKTLYKGINGIHQKDKNVTLLDCKSIKIHLDEASYVHTDGEVLGSMTDVEVHCVPGALNMIV